jgi:hypothetical protein
MNLSSNLSAATNPTPPSAAQTEDDARPSLSQNDLQRVRRIHGEIRGALPKLPHSIVAEVTNLLSTMEGHLAAEPPNPVSTGEALALIRDQLECVSDDPFAAQLAEQTKPVLKLLGETV